MGCLKIKWSLQLLTTGLNQSDGVSLETYFINIHVLFSVYATDGRVNHLNDFTLECIIMYLRLGEHCFLLDISIIILLYLKYYDWNVK